MKLSLDGLMFRTILNILNKAGICWSNGAKPDIGVGMANEIKLSDASGFVRFLFHYTTNKTVILPQSKMMQRLWFKAHGIQKCNYTEAGKRDNFLRIAFSSNHVWFIHNGSTAECSQYGNGIHSRDWNNQDLINGQQVCFKIGEMIKPFEYKLLTVDKFVLKEIEVEEPELNLRPLKR